MSESPDIDTPRFTLRKLTSEDALALSRILDDPHVAIRMMCDVSTREKSLMEAASRVASFPWHGISNTFTG